MRVPKQHLCLFVLCLYSCFGGIAGGSEPVSLPEEGASILPKIMHQSEGHLTAQGYFQKSQGLAERGNLQEAERYLKKSLDLDPANAFYHFELANLYALRHDASKKSSRKPKQSEMLAAAARELERATMLDPELLPAQYNLGVVYKRQGRYEEARDQFRQALDIDPKSAPAYMQIGMTYEEQGFFDEAKDSYAKAKDFDFTNPGIQGAMEDLKLSEEEAEEERRRALADSRFRRLQGQFFQTPFSGAAQYETQSQADFQAASDVRQAIPFLGAWLIQEFMKFRANLKEE